MKLLFSLHLQQKSQLVLCYTIVWMKKTAFFFVLLYNILCFHHILSAHPPKQTFNLGCAPVAVSAALGIASPDGGRFSTGRNGPLTEYKRKQKERTCLSFLSNDCYMRVSDSLHPQSPALRGVWRRVGRDSYLASNSLLSSLCVWCRSCVKLKNQEKMVSKLIMPCVF